MNKSHKKYKKINKKYCNQQFWRCWQFNEQFNKTFVSRCCGAHGAWYCWRWQFKGKWTKLNLFNNEYIKIESLIVNNIPALITNSRFHLFWLVSVIIIKEINTFKRKKSKNNKRLYENEQRSKKIHENQHKILQPTILVMLEID